jgi:hypothetical protein
MKKVFESVEAGLSYREIASRLGITKDRVWHIMRLKNGKVKLVNGKLTIMGRPLMPKIKTQSVLRTSRAPERCDEYKKYIYKRQQKYLSSFYDTTKQQPKLIEKIRAFENQVDDLFDRLLLPRPGDILPRLSEFLVLWLS